MTLNNQWVNGQFGILLLSRVEYLIGKNYLIVRCDCDKVARSDNDCKKRWAHHCIGVFCLLLLSLLVSVLWPLVFLSLVLPTLCSMLLLLLLPHLALIYSLSLFTVIVVVVVAIVNNNNNGNPCKSTCASLPSSALMCTSPRALSLLLHWCHNLCCHCSCCDRCCHRVFHCCDHGCCYHSSHYVC